MSACLISQRWDDMLFAHWPVHPDALRTLLPRGVEPDVFGGQSWIGIVAFRMTDTRAGGLLPARGLGSIPELNVRTYVRVAGEPGVWFLSLDTSSPLFVTGGRALYGLAYHHARMIVRREGSRFHFVSERGPAAFVARYEPVGCAASPAAGSLEHWLVERYRLFGLRGRRLVTAAVVHPALVPTRRRRRDRGEHTRAHRHRFLRAAVAALLTGSGRAHLGAARRGVDASRRSAGAPRRTGAACRV
jgi:uncharacterized protein